MLTLSQVEEAGGYGVILADPPWSYSDGGSGKAVGFARYRGVNQHYGTMALQDLCLLPVERLAAQDCALFMWGCWPLLAEMLALGKAWGFRYKTLAFDWIKTYTDGTPVNGLGRWTRSSSEGCFLFTRGKPQRANKGVRQALETLDPETVKSPLQGHSVKPPEVRERIRLLMGVELPAIELFARDRAEGFDAWGNEVPGGPDVEL